MKILLVLSLILAAQNSFSAIEIQDEVFESSTQVEEDGEYLLRQERAVGVGATIGGALGLGGVRMEFGLQEKNSVLLGFGGGSPFLAFSVEYKKTLFGETLLPYYSFGFAHWRTSSDRKDGISETSPDFVRAELMSKEDAKQGRVSENLIYPAIGLQYYQKSGSLKGSSVYLEVSVLSDVFDFAFAPTGSVGYLYYFH